MSNVDDRPYEVGNCKPPKHSQFKKGQSGNPKGRKRKASIIDMTAREMVSKIVSELIPVRIGNRQVTLPKKYAVIVGIVHDSLSGTPNQRLKAFECLNKFGAFDLTPNDRMPTPDEQDAINYAIVEELAKEAEREAALRGENYDHTTGVFRKIESR